MWNRWGVFGPFWVFCILCGIGGGSEKSAGVYISFFWSFLCGIGGTFYALSIYIGFFRVFCDVHRHFDPNFPILGSTMYLLTPF
jgi:hypothetical protein